MNEFDTLISKKIPDNNNLEVWEMSDFKDEYFVRLPNMIMVNGDIKIIVDMQYPKLGMKYAIKECYLRKEVLKRLLLAATYLPEGIAFKVWDGYRSWNLQDELYYDYKPNIIKQFKLQDLSFHEQRKIISRYVSVPSNDVNNPPLHTTGGSIDLTLFDLVTKNNLDLGLEFDEFTDLTNTSSFEGQYTDWLVRDNRRMLYNIMIKAGFTNLPSEVWHYDYGNRAYGYYMKTEAIYKGIFKIEDMDNVVSLDVFLDDIRNDNDYISKYISNYCWKYED